MGIWCEVHMSTHTKLTDSTCVQARKDGAQNSGAGLIELRKD